MAKASKFLREKFLKTSDVEAMDESERDCVISHVSLRPVGREKRLVLFTDKHKTGLPLNDARIEQLIDIHGGIDDTDKWRKTKIRLYVDYDVEYDGESVGGVRIESRE